MNACNFASSHNMAYLKPKNSKFMYSTEDRILIKYLID